jgi:hypothetical protein
MFRIEHNVETGEIKQIELSAAEVKKLEKQYAEAKANDDKAKAETEAKEAARQAILDRLGLTADELQTILG